MTDANAPADETRAQQRLAMLRELAEIGMRLARGVERQAENPEAPEVPEAPGRADLGLVFSRIARAVRQTLALEARMQEELAARLRRAQERREIQRAVDTRAPIDRRAQVVRRAVKQAIEAEVHDHDEAEQLFDDLDERLCDREDDEDFLDAPVSELIARICKDLGVTPDWSLWEDETWTKEEAAPAANASEAAPEVPPDPPPPDDPPPPAKAGSYWQPSAP